VQRKYRICQYYKAGNTDLNLRYKAWRGVFSKV
jgi:hypothetical protein